MPCQILISALVRTFHIIVSIVFIFSIDHTGMAVGLLDIQYQSLMISFCINRAGLSIVSHGRHRVLLLLTGRNHEGNTVFPRISTLDGFPNAQWIFLVQISMG